MSRAQLTSTVEQNSAGAAAPVVAGKNFIINGGMDIAQRGSSVTLSGAFAYSLDRWNHNYNSSHTVSQQSTGVPAGSRYCMRVTTNAAGVCYAAQIIETANVVPLQGQTVTITAKIRRNSSFAGDIILGLSKSSTVDAAANASYTAIGSVTATNANMPTGTGSANWYTMTASFAVPNDGTANTLKFEFTPNTSQSSVGAYYEIAQCQIEVGAVATPFSRAGTTVQGELAACQRYYFQSFSAIQPPSNVALAVSANAAWTNVAFPTPMRTNPTIVIYNYLSNANKIDQVGTLTNQGTITAATPQISRQGFIQIGDSSNTLSSGTQYWFWYTASAEL
jgi:hypothetical protein